MTLGSILERFLQEAPVAVMYRALLERVFDPAELDALFERNARDQYTRDVLFSAVVELMAAVVFGVKPSVRAAYLRPMGEIAASLTAVYEKLKRVEPGVCRALVGDTSASLRRLVDRLDAHLPVPVEGYRVKVVDGNHLTGTDHRVPATRTTRAAALPGQALVVLDLATMLVVDVVPCEDAHTQERALVDDLKPGVEAGDLWIADRNFCTTRMLFLLRSEGARFLIRQHKSTLIWAEASAWSDAGRTDTGAVAEQAIAVRESDDGAPIAVRRIRLTLERATRSEDREIFLISDVPEADATAAQLADAYRKRWRLENVFQTLTEALRCEIDTLAYPRAALLGFCTALVAYNLLATVRAALRSAHGAEAVESKVSNYYLAEEVASTHQGLRIAVEGSEWTCFARMTEPEFAGFLTEAASQAQLRRYPKSTRGPKKPPPRRDSGKTNHHVSTARLIDQQKKRK